MTSFLVRHPPPPMSWNVMFQLTPSPLRGHDVICEWPHIQNLIFFGRIKVHFGEWKLTVCRQFKVRVWSMFVLNSAELCTYSKLHSKFGLLGDSAGSNIGFVKFCKFEIRNFWVWTGTNTNMYIVEYPRYTFWRNFNIKLFANSLYFWGSDPLINRF